MVVLIDGQKIWTSRSWHPTELLIARTTPLEEVKKKTDGLTAFPHRQRESGPRAESVSPTSP